MNLKEFKEDHIIIMTCFGHGHFHIKISIASNLSPYLKMCSLTLSKEKNGNLLP